MIIHTEEIPDKFRNIILYNAMCKLAINAGHKPVSRQYADTIFDDHWYVYDFPYRDYLRCNKLEEYYSLANWYSYCYYILW